MNWMTQWWRSINLFHSFLTVAFIHHSWMNGNKMPCNHSNSIRRVLLLLDTHPRGALVIGWAFFGCHWGNRMTASLTHGRKCHRRISLAPSVRLPFKHWSGGQGTEAAIGPFGRPTNEGAGPRFACVRQPNGDLAVKAAAVVGSPPESMAVGFGQWSEGDAEERQRWWKRNKETQVR